MAIPWFVMPGLMFGISTYLKSMGTRGKFRWITKPELEVRSQSILVNVTTAQSGDALPAPPDGYMWKPIQLTFQSGPLASPAVVEIHVLQEAPQESSTGTAGFLSVEHLASMGRHGHGGGHHHGGHHRGGGGNWGGGWGYPYVAPLYVEELPIMPTETWTVDWVASNGARQQQVVRTELEARRLKDSLTASKIAATITRGGVI
jgi:hypothetical protein